MMNQQTLWLSDRSDRRPVPWIQIAYSLLYASRPTCDWLGFPAIWLVNLDPATTRDCCRQNRTTHSCKIHVCRQTQVNNKGTCSKRDVHAVGSWRPSCVTNCDLVVQERVGRLVAGLSLLPHPVLGIGCRVPTDLKLLRSTVSFKSKLKSFLFHADYIGNTVWTLECAIGLIVAGALQVTVTKSCSSGRYVVWGVHWRKMPNCWRWSTL